MIKWLGLSFLGAIFFLILYITFLISRPGLLSEFRVFAESLSKKNDFLVESSFIKKVRVKSHDRDNFEYLFNYVHLPSREREIEAELIIPFFRISAQHKSWPLIVFPASALGHRSDHDQEKLIFFRSLGYATLTYDSFRSRNIKDGSYRSPSILSYASEVEDLFSTLEFLKRDPNSRIDWSNVGILGRSRGGTISLLSAWTPVYSFYQSKFYSDFKFSFHIALYPFCYLWEEYKFSSSPILIIDAAQDTWPQSDACKELVSHLPRKNVTYKVYEGVVHGFDAHYKRRSIMESHSFKNCRFQFDSKARFLNLLDNKVLTNPQALAEAVSQCGSKSEIFVGGNYQAKARFYLDTLFFLKGLYRGP